MIQNNFKMTETLAHGYSSESAQQQLSNEYQHNRVKMVFKKMFILVLLTKVTLALEGLSGIGMKELNDKRATIFGYRSSFKLEVKKSSKR